MSPEDQEFLALLINRTGGRDCAETAILLGRAVRRLLVAEYEYNYVVPHSKQQTEEWLNARMALQGLVQP